MRSLGFFWLLGISFDLTRGNARAVKLNEGDNMNIFKSLFSLFVSMMKIGAFTFGGGYAMISLLDNEFVTRKKWIDSEEFMDLVTIAESTPGPIAINCSTYIGYKRHGILGAAVATLGMCLPSFAIIYLISLFFNSFLDIPWVASAFRGIQACVVFLIFSAGLKMLRKIKKTTFNVAVMLVTSVVMIAFALFSISFSSIFYILISGALGLSIYSVRYIKSRGSEDGEK
jgi:chromate transporter